MVQSGGILEVTSANRPADVDHFKPQSPGTMTQLTLYHPRMGELGPIVNSLSSRILNGGFEALRGFCLLFEGIYTVVARDPS